MRLVCAYFAAEYFPFDKMPMVKDIVSMKDPSELRHGDILVVWGGADISPTLYSRPVSRYCHATSIPSHRDRIEWNLMHRAVELNIPIMGICRGAQMLCALAGGWLLQDVNHHAGHHHVVTAYDGYEFVVNSAHHQMMYPYDVKHEMLASIKPARATAHFDVDNIQLMTEDPECVYFPDVKGFAVQWHPEWMEDDSSATKWIFNEFTKRV